MVRNDFNQIGSLIENKLLPKDAFMDTYWYTILRCWIALKGDIVEERETGGNPSYMKNFEHLNDLADQYREHKYPEIKPKFPNKTQ